jgi:hypothetical protein
MGSGTFSPAANGDDGRWSPPDESNFFSNSGDNLDIGALPNSFHSFIRFTNITIPKNAIIDSAKVVFKAYSTETATTCNLKIYFDNADNASAPAYLSSA